MTTTRALAGTVPPGEEASSLARALQLIRDLEDLGTDGLAQCRAGILHQTAVVLGAEALLIFSLDPDGEIAISDLYGPIPDETEVRALVRSARGLIRSKRGRVHGSTEPPLLLASSADRELFLAALFPSEVAGAGSWREAFLEYMGDKLLAVEEPVEAVESHPPGEVLAFPSGMVAGSSPAIQEVLERLRAIVGSRLDILLLGETGTGKELFARLIHGSGPTARGPFVAINCAAIPGELLEAELFGVLGRVATGVDARPGLILQADGGTLFLDEIGDMPDRLQAKILRVLQEREVLPVGASAARKVQVRVISASNRDLPRLVREGSFRADLYYRLRGAELQIPPLRERREDIPALALAFASRAAERYGKKVRGIGRGALRLLVDHPWPGNIRELQSVVEEAVLRCPRGGTVEREHFLLACAAALHPSETLPPEAPPATPPPPLNDRFPSLQERVEAVEREAILEALRATKGRKTPAAKLLGLTRQGLALKMARLKIET